MVHDWEIGMRFQVDNSGREKPGAFTCYGVTRTSGKVKRGALYSDASVWALAPAPKDNETLVLKVGVAVAGEGKC